MDNILFDKFKIFRPQATPEEAEAASVMIKRQYPNASDEEIGDAFETAAAVTGQGTLTPKGYVLANMFEEDFNKGLINDVPPLAPEPQGFKNNVYDYGNASAPVTSTVQPPVADTAQVPQAPQVPQETSSNVPTRNATGEALGGLFAALGGPAVAKQYADSLAAKDTAAEKAVDIENKKAELAIQKEKWESAKKESAARLKEQIDYADPKSAVSTVAREAVRRMINQDPKFAETVSKMDLENMSATQITKLLPFVDKVVDNTTQQLKLQQQKELNDAKTAYQQQLLDVKLSTLGAGGGRRSGGGGGGSRGSSGYSGSGAPSGELDAEGKISGIKVDRQRNRTLDPIVAKQLAGKQESADAANQFLKVIPEIEKVLPDSSQSGVGALLGKAQSFVGVGDIGAANKRMEQFANSALAALDSPLMKGAPSEADARRALSVINDPTAPLNVKKEALNQFRVILKNTLDTHNEAVKQYDVETRRKLKGIGVNEVGQDSSLASTSSPQTKVINGVTYKKVSGGWEQQ